METLKNHVTLIGNLGSKPEITNFDNGNKIARFRLATNKYTMKDKKAKVEWHRVFAWGNIAKFIENHAEKGKQLAIHGRLVNRTYLNKEGKRRKITEVEIKHVIGL
ncbi:MAG: single-stranded DNA-binding protein [Crocinitomicaceae bacterium]|jgi:single-strand DNA-binding protein|nr:single-stranded DNA-binding protein [Crocinitomicaceae bacterium]|tara:strand:+ start:1398 stop:1715 length:318 start_codon:yes stop_codon:yes gene_type:complete